MKENTLIKYKKKRHYCLFLGTFLPFFFAFLDLAVIFGRLALGFEDVPPKRGVKKSLVVEPVLMKGRGNDFFIQHKEVEAKMDFSKKFFQSNFSQILKAFSIHAL
jgi:hypothetical protein